MLHVIFGAGPVGLATMRELVKAGERVRIVNRSGKVSAPAGVEVCAGDASDKAQTRKLAQGAETVYFCVNPPYHEWAEKFPPMHTAILDAAIHTGAKLIAMENVYAYGEVDRPMTEDLPYNAHTKKGQVRAKMSEELWNAQKRGDVRAAIARASDFYGPGVFDSALGDRVFAALVQGKAAQVVGNIDVPHTFTYMEDVGRTLAILGRDERALGHIWHVPNAPDMTTRQVITLAAQLAGVEPKITALGKPMVWLIGRFIPALREIYEMMYEFEKPFSVDSSKFTRTFGVSATAYADGIAATLAWYREHLSVQLPR
ncbi:MAG: NAD-dependent epimerase/dehydratase family protein [Anaerolinea sp.]|nr:NAD-dependent epimerase/dehydratase family protein [Anaerolinea sp.]